MSEKIKGIAGTLIVHATIALCFVFYAFKTPTVNQETVAGLEINLGYSDDGTGNIQPPETGMSTEFSAESQKGNNIIMNVMHGESINSIESSSTENESETKENAIYRGNRIKKGGNEGETGKPGDQGKPDGNPYSKNYYGDYTPGNNVSYSLKGRTARNIPSPNYILRDEGTVVVSIWVNNKGDVTRALPGYRGTTTTSPALWKLAVDAASRASFDIMPGGPEEQKGTITYTFINQN